MPLSGSGTMNLPVHQPVPAIYTHGTCVMPLSLLQRGMALATAAACLAVLAVAAHPDWSPAPAASEPTVRSDLPRAIFSPARGLPCPSCGMTTSFAYFVRGNLLASIYVQPIGFRARRC